MFINADIKEANDFRRRYIWKTHYFILTLAFSFHFFFHLFSLIVQEGDSGGSSSVLTCDTVYPTREEFLKTTVHKHVDEIRECGKVCTFS